MLPLTTPPGIRLTLINWRDSRGSKNDDSRAGRSFFFDEDTPVAWLRERELRGGRMEVKQFICSPF
jgi:hypothetical protein